MIENKKAIWGLMRMDENGKPPSINCGDYFVESDENEGENREPKTCYISLEKIYKGILFKPIAKG